MRLIDADLLIKELKKEEDEYKAKICENENDDPFSDGVLSALFTISKIINSQPACNNNPFPCKVGDTVYLKVACECISTTMDRETGVVECPFECDCEFEECNNGNEQLIETTIESIFNDGHGWYCSLNHICIDVPISDFGKTVFLTKSKTEKAIYEAVVKKGSEI